MLHLLPEQQKNIVTTEYHKRLGIAVCLFVIIVSIWGLVMLLPSYIVAYGRYSKVNEKKEQVQKQLAQVSVNTNEDTLKEVSDRIAALSPLGAKEDASTTYTRFLTLSMLGIRSTRLSYTLNKDKTVLFTVNGVASNRETLLAFAETVNNSGYFTGARVPLSSLRIDKNVTFSFKLGVITPQATSTNPI